MYATQIIGSFVGTGDIETDLNQAALLVAEKEFSGKQYIAGELHKVVINNMTGIITDHCGGSVWCVSYKGNNIWEVTERVN